MRYINANDLGTIQTTTLTYSKSSKTFVGEASELGLNLISATGYNIQNPKTGNTELFKFTKRDMNDGDVMGWRYQFESGYKLLIIND